MTPYVETSDSAGLENIWAWLAELPDPEVPVVSVVDLGMIRDVEISDGAVRVSVAPTYSGCPATDVIEQNIVSCLRDKGIADVTIRRVLSPPWTTDWISEAGREKLRAYGIAPPIGSAGKRSLLGALPKIACPCCASSNTEQVSEFGSTACKASYKCRDCLEPFEYFKCI
ncbi:MAG: phenylacetate-CoA oxygenase subunit PaaJ [Gammaproteobacteria bacterium]|nr:phenylacetate-CoA oxygenase subunit PaaJ [Gammaproteobacteria bacterium]MDH5213626.1 phenylacetate-CoA oxygenase subunit PaaJ [Gammaproteobacteria bacterium]